MRVIVVLMLGVLVLAGCGQRVDGDAAPEPAPGGQGDGPCSAAPVTSEPPIRYTRSGTLPKGVKNVPEVRVDTSALPDSYQDLGQVWVFDDGCSLETFANATDGCGGAAAEILDQSAHAVKIELRSVPSKPKEGTGCTMALEPKPVVVRLSAPLEDRTVRLTA